MKSRVQSSLLYLWKVRGSKATQDEWNRAEADIKTAEMGVHSIVIPSVKELRYGGRRVIDALMEIARNPNNADNTRIKALLDDAHFDCHRARHDAIDAAKIAADLEIMTAKLGTPLYWQLISIFLKTKGDPPALPGWVRSVRALCRHGGSPCGSWSQLRS